MKGSDPTLSDVLVDVKTFSTDHSGLGMWIRLDTDKTEGAVCRLPCGSVSCSAISTPTSAVARR